ncbi:hypothetical protein ACQPZF_23215 [Actinosynnema sp. CS-041913]|uniref:hypothetical protein n=1 Tax=Actinosynnema sp. CS-041913 TaxID=3239917 RepID=UPI003D91F68E
MNSPSRQSLIETVRARLAVLSPDASLDAEEGELVVPLPDGRARISLASLVEQADRTPSGEWDALAVTWLTSVRKNIELARSEATAPPDRLRVQFRRHQPAPANLVTLPYDENFDLAVVVDHETRVSALTREQASAFGVSLDEIGKRAVQQTIVAELGELDVRDHPVPGGMSTRLIAHDGNPYVHTVLMSLKRFTPGEAPFGALVSVPRRSAVLLHEVYTRDVLDFLVPFSRMARSLHDGASDPFGPEVYWWAAGRYHEVRIEDTGADTARAHLPAEVRPIVDRLV